MLYESSVFPAGMVATSAKEAVRMFGLRLSTDVAETAKRLVSNNDLDGERTAAVYEADVPTLDLQTDVVGKYTKLLLLRSPGMHAAAAFPESLQVIKSIHNPDAAVDISPADLLATCSVLSSLRMRILPNPPPTESTPSNRLEAVVCLRIVFCPRHAPTHSSLRFYAMQVSPANDYTFFALQYTASSLDSCCLSSNENNYALRFSSNTGCFAPSLRPPSPRRLIVGV